MQQPTTLKWGSKIKAKAKSRVITDKNAVVVQDRFGSRTNRHSFAKLAHIIGSLYEFLCRNGEAFLDFLAHDFLRLTLHPRKRGFTFIEAFHLFTLFTRRKDALISWLTVAMALQLTTMVNHNSTSPTNQPMNLINKQRTPSKPWTNI